MRLDREGVVETALSLLNEVGLEGLSLRRLAQELDVQAPALYRVFASKEDLLQAMADSMLAGVMSVLDRPEPGADWADWLVARCRAVRRALLSYRDGGRLKEYLRPTPDQWHGLELLLQMMEEAGFTIEDAMRAIHALGHHTFGAVSAEQEARLRQAATGDEVRIDSTRFPRVARGITLRTPGPRLRAGVRVRPAHLHLRTPELAQERRDSPSKDMTIPLPPRMARAERGSSCAPEAQPVMLLGRLMGPWPAGPSGIAHGLHSQNFTRIPFSPFPS